MRFNPEDYEHEWVKSSCRFDRIRNSAWRAMFILHHVRRHLEIDIWRVDPGPHITDAILMIDLCISRVNSDLKI